MNEYYSAKVLETDDGLTICEDCEAEIICNDCGDMPEICPGCGATLDYSLYDGGADCG